MTYKVTYTSPYNFSIKSSQPSNYKAALNFNIEIAPMNLNELTDVQIIGNNYKIDVISFTYPSA